MSVKTTIQPKITDLNRKIDVHVKPISISDRIAYGFVKVLRFFADKFFAKRYGCRCFGNGRGRSWHGWRIMATPACTAQNAR